MAIVGGLLATIVLLILPPLAQANFVYWANNSPVSSIGRAKINGTGPNNAFIGGLSGNPFGVSVDSKFIYWTENAANRIGRANLDGSGVNSNFITTGVAGPVGIAVTQNNGIYWVNSTGTDTIGHANLDGSNPVASFVSPVGTNLNGMAADQSFLYWTNVAAIGRAPLGAGSGDPSFTMGAANQEGLAVDPSFLYWTNGTTGVGRTPVGGGTPNPAFLPNLTTANPPRGVAVNSQYIFWSDADLDRIGRANINGSAPNSALITVSGGQEHLMAAAPSNKITVNSIAKKKSKGTATINAKVPGPGQITLNQTSTPPDANATAAAVKQVGLTITQASSFTLAVKPVGKTAKKLNKQIKKQLKKKRKAKATAKVTTYIHFVPAGVAGVPNTLQVNVTLVKQRKKK